MGEWTSFGSFGNSKPVRREPPASAYWYALGIVRERHGLSRHETLAPGTYLVDDGDAALVIEIDDIGRPTFSFDTSCPPTSEWVGR